MENASLFVAGVDGIDAVFTGHQHLVFPGRRTSGRHRGRRSEKGTLQGKPAVMAGFWGSHMGLIDLLLETRRQRAGRSSLRPPRRGRSIERVDDKNKVIAMSPTTKRSRRRAQDRPRGDARLCPPPVGKTSAPLYSYFALVADDPSVQIVSQAQTWYIKEMLEGHRSGRICRSSRRPRRSRPAAATAPTTTPTCRSATSPSRTSPTSTSIRTPCGRGDHRRAGEGMAGDVGRHLQPDRAGRRPTRRSSTRLSRPTISTSSTASPTRSTCRSRAATMTTASWRTRMRTASST